MEWLLDKTKMQLPITNSYLIILILFGSLMLNFWLFINGFVNLSFVLTTDIELPFMIFRFEGFLPLPWIWHILPQFSTSLPKFWLIVSSLGILLQLKSLPFSAFLVKLSCLLMICWRMNLMMTFC